MATSTAATTTMQKPATVTRLAVIPSRCARRTSGARKARPASFRRFERRELPRAARRRSDG